MNIEDIFQRVDVTTEEDGWAVVDTFQKEEPLLAGVVSDASSFGVIPNLDQPYGDSITLDELPVIEEDLLPEDVARLLFLVLDEVPTLILQKCVVKMTPSGKSKVHSDSFSAWARRTKGSIWKPLFLEGLAVIGRIDVLACLGLEEDQINRLKSKPVYVPALKLSLNKVCCELRREEVSKLVQFVARNYLPDHVRPVYPEGRILGQLLELYLLYWMQEQVISLTDLSRLAEGLRNIRREDLVRIISSPERPQAAPCFAAQQSVPVPASPAASQHNFHSKTVHLTSLGEPHKVKWYPNSRGVCVIFNQEAFQCGNPQCDLTQIPDHGYRRGSSHDAVNLEETFKMFGCRTKTFHSLNAEMIESRLELLSKANDLENFDFIVLCFLSHGGTSAEADHFIYSSDCKRLEVEKLAAYFGGDCCKALAGKLKMVITQACQGTRSLVVDDGPSSAPTSQTSATSRRSHVTPLSDFLFCQATTPGYKAYREPHRGSFYIRSLCQVLADRGDLMEVTLCIKDVHARMLATPVYLESERRYCTMQPQIIDRTAGQFILQRVNSEPAAGHV